MIKKSLYPITAFILVSIAALLVSCGGGTWTQAQNDGGGTLTIGYLVDENKQNEAGAEVALYNADERVVYKSSTTDKNGKYSFDSVPKGTYTIIGKASDGKMVFIEPFNRDSVNQMLDLGTDTVYIPGSIQGCIRYPQVANIKRDVIVYIPGTSFNAMVDDTTPFVMSRIPKGTYTLKFSGTGFTKTVAGVTVQSATVSVFDSCITLDVDTVGNPPAPLVQSVEVLSEDSGTVLLKWYGVEVADVNGYEIYRIDSSGTLEKTGITTDTFFIDTVFKNRTSDTLAQTIAYQIKTIDKDNNTSDSYSEKLSIKVYPPFCYTTRLSWVIKSAKGSDTITNRDTAVICLTLKSCKRVPNTVTWSADNVLNEIRNQTITAHQGADSCYTGYDTLRYFWNTEGTKNVIVRSIDNVGKESLDSCEIDIYDSASLYPHNKWVELDALSEARYHAVAVATDSILYVIGGEKRVLRPQTQSWVDTAVATVERYNLKTHAKMTAGVALPGGRYFAGAAVIDNVIYVIGGTDRKADYATIYSYHNSDSEWREQSVKLPGTLSCMAVCVYNSSIYIIGGMRDNFTYTSQILQFNPSSGTVDSVGSLSFARVCHQAVVLDGKIYIMGGYDEYGTQLSSVEIFDPVSKSISSGPLLSKSRLLFSAGVLSNTIYVAGGLSSLDNNQVYDDILSYNLLKTSDGWSTLSLIGSSLYGMAAVIADGRFFTFGGTGDVGSVVNGTTRAQVYYP